MTGLLLFAQAQTQSPFRLVSGDGAVSAASATNDAVTAGGALMVASGLACLVAMRSPLRVRDRLVPVALLIATTGVLFAAHFSIFTNGIIMPDDEILLLQTSHLFHDTAATTSIATFILAFATLLVLTFAGFALMALIAPQALNDQFLKPRTLTPHRARLLVVTLVLVATGSVFAAHFIALGPHSDVNAHSSTHRTIGIAVLALLLCIAWRTYRLLSGRIGNHERRRPASGYPRTPMLESVLFGLILVTTLAVLAGAIPYDPSLATDPVFAVSGQGVYWFFLLVLAIYPLQRRLSSTCLTAMNHTRPGVRRKLDRLLAVGAVTMVFWSLGFLWGLHEGLTPQQRLVAQMAPIVLIVPLFAFERRATQPRLLLLFSWSIMSVLTGIMLWGSGNSVAITLVQGGAEPLAFQSRLLDPSAAGLRLAGSALIAAPIVFAMRLHRSRHALNDSPGQLIVVGLGLIYVLHTLFTINPAMHVNGSAESADVTVGFWANSLAEGQQILVATTLIGLTAAISMLSGWAHLRQRRRATPTPVWSGWWKPWHEALAQIITRRVPVARRPAANAHEKDPSKRIMSSRLP